METNIVCKKLFFKLKERKRVAETFVYRKVVSSNTSGLEAHADFFHLACEGDFSSLRTVTF